MSRAVKEWIGKTDDTAAPPRVKLRVFKAHGGICHIAKRRIRAGEPWDTDHVVALINGGENRESNLAPALREKHKVKTAADVAEKARVDRKQKSHYGIRTAKRPMPGGRDTPWKKKITGEVVPR